MNRTDVMLVVNIESGVCVNAVMVGGDWAPPDGHTLIVPAGDEWIGWVLQPDGTWASPDPQGG